MPSMKTQWRDVVPCSRAALSLAAFVFALSLSAGAATESADGLVDGTRPRNTECVWPAGIPKDLSLVVPKAFTLPANRPNGGEWTFTTEGLRDDSPVRDGSASCEVEFGSADLAFAQNDHYVVADACELSQSAGAKPGTFYRSYALMLQSGLGGVMYLKCSSGAMLPQEIDQPEAFGASVLKQIFKPYLD